MLSVKVTTNQILAPATFPLSFCVSGGLSIATSLCAEAVKQVIKTINAQGVNSEEDVVKVIRKGEKPATATQSEWPGTVFVELKSAEVRAKIMKAKKCLASVPTLKEV